jgi:hypothetical protein
MVFTNSQIERVFFRQPTACTSFYTTEIAGFGRCLVTLLGIAAELTQQLYGSNEVLPRETGGPTGN